MTTTDTVSVHFNIGVRQSAGFLNPEKMDMGLLTSHMEAIIPTPDTLYSILDERDAINITEVSLRSICEGAWTSNSSATTYRFELKVDIRHIGTISDAAVAKISRAIFENGTKNVAFPYQFTDPFHTYKCLECSSPTQLLCGSTPPYDEDNDPSHDYGYDDEDEAFYELIEIGIALNGGRLQMH